jgi:hypothetical protein
MRRAKPDGVPACNGRPQHDALGPFLLAQRKTRRSGRVFQSTLASFFEAGQTSRHSHLGLTCGGQQFRQVRKGRRVASAEVFLRVLGDPSVVYKLNVVMKH